MQIFNQAPIFACRIHFNGKTEKLYEKVTTNNKRLMMTAFARHNRKNKKIAWKNRRNDTNIHLFVDRTKIANYLIFIHSIFGFRQSQVKAEKNLRNSRKFIEIIYCHFPAECNCENEKNAEKYMEMIMKKKKRISLVQQQKQNVRTHRWSQKWVSPTRVQSIAIKRSSMYL